MPIVIIHLRDFLVRMLVVAIFVPVGIAAAQTPPHASSGIAADKAAQRAEFAELIEGCQACHGEAELPADPEFPVLAGQHFYYLYVQLKDFGSGLRASEIMSPIAADLTKAQKKALAQYFSEQPWPATGYRTDKSVVASGERSVVGGACTACHLGGFLGYSRVPRVSGQQVDYIKKTLSDFKSGERKNAPSKSALFGSYTNEQIDALSQYLAGM